MRWDVVAVQAEPPLGLVVSFADGARGKVRFEPDHLTGVFAALRDPKLFAQVYVDHGAVAWPGDIDLAPDAMYAEIRRTGEWILR